MFPAEEYSRREKYPPAPLRRIGSGPLPNREPNRKGLRIEAAPAAPDRFTAKRALRTRSIRLALACTARRRPPPPTISLSQVRLSRTMQRIFLQYPARARSPIPCRTPHRRPVLCRVRPPRAEPTSRSSTAPCIALPQVRPPRQSGAVRHRPVYERQHTSLPARSAKTGEKQANTVRKQPDAPHKFADGKIFSIFLFYVLHNTKKKLISLRCRNKGYE